MTTPTNTTQSVTNELATTNSSSTTTTTTESILTTTDRQTIKNYLEQYQLVMREEIGTGSYSSVFKVANQVSQSSSSTSTSPQPLQRPPSGVHAGGGNRQGNNTNKVRHIKRAVKVINIRASEHYATNHLPMEIFVIKFLNHPNIIKMYEIARPEAHLVVMMMEFARNGTVADHLASAGRYREANGRALFQQILFGLQFMHHHHIAHRDLKVENILLVRPDVPKLCDFSFSTIVDPGNPLSKNYCGSLPFFSPQILKNVPYDPFGADVWSIGVCLYVMLNNTIPFNIRSETEMLKAQLERNWRFSRRASTELSLASYHFVSRMLEPDVAKRATVDELLQDQWFIMANGGVGNNTMDAAMSSTKLN